MTPKSAARRATCAARALATSVLVGMQPSLTQVPPRCSRSISAVFMPALARRTARNGPAWPVPMTMASNDVVMGSPGATVGRPARLLQQARACVACVSWHPPRSGSAAARIARWRRAGLLIAITCTSSSSTTASGISPRFRKANPDHVLGKPFVYVGMTGLDPDLRFDRHKAGIQANRYVTEYGLRLLPRALRRLQPDAVRRRPGHGGRAGDRAARGRLRRVAGLTGRAGRGQRR